MSLVQLTNVKKTFSGKNGNIQAVDDVSLNAEKGDIYGIIGYFGARRSTLVRLLNGLELPTSGEVIVNDQDIIELKNKELRTFRKKIGMIFQHFSLLWSGIVLENIQLPLELTGVPKSKCKERAEELLRLVGLEGRGQAYPSQLSGGQKQRVGIARALASDPEILLCDETTNALDPQTTEEALGLLLAINKKSNLTIVSITREMSVIRKICNKVAVMELGKVVEEGDVLTVLKQPKKKVTKRFVQQDVEPEADSTELLAGLIKENPSGRLATLTFSERDANEPVISQAIRRYSIDINVVCGKIKRVKEGSSGSLTVSMTGETKELDQAEVLIKEQGVEIEVIHRG